MLARPSHCSSFQKIDEWEIGNGRQEEFRRQGSGKSTRQQHQDARRE
jgi:hypothetical protein